MFANIIVMRSIPLVIDIPPAKHAYLYGYLFATFLPDPNH